MTALNLTTASVLAKAYQQIGQGARGSFRDMANLVRDLVDTLATINFSGLLATADEINRIADVSNRLVTITATGSISEATHEGKTCLLGEVGGNALVTLTMPPATGGGARYRFVCDVVNTSNYVFKAASGADVFRGTIVGNSTGDAATAALLAWASGTTDDTLTFDGTTTGMSKRGDWIEFEDTNTDAWTVRGFVTQSGVEATPFSDTVA